MEEMLEMGVSRMDDALASAPVYASALASTGAKTRRVHYYCVPISYYCSSSK